jgi:hypothetical protein
MGIAGIGPLRESYPALASHGECPTRSQAAAETRLSPEEQAQVQKLRQIDQKVRAHEQAHLSAAAGLAIGGANFQTVRGPDGKQYAVAGEVSIDVSSANTPEQTIDKARRIQAAALAPADPSSQDRAVAAAAAQMQIQAQAELNRQKQEEARQEEGGSAAISPALQAYAALEPAPEPLLSLFA